MERAIEKLLCCWFIIAVCLSGNTAEAYTPAPGTNGQIVFNSSGYFAAFSMAGDCTFSSPTITCTKTGGNAFGALATLGVGTGLSSGGGNLNISNGSANTLAGFNNAGVFSGVTVSTGLSLIGGVLTSTAMTAPGGVQYDVQLNDGSGGFAGSNNLNFQGGYLTINGDSGYGQLQFLNSPTTGGYGGAGINGTAGEIIPGAAAGDLSIWASQSISLGGNAGNAIQLGIDGATGKINIPELTASQLMATDASSNLQSLATATYPSLTELSYVKGVTSAIQTQLNGKQATGNYITALTGDIAASGPGSAASTLATVNANTGSFGDGTHIPNFTANGKGLITAAGSTAIVLPANTTATTSNFFTAYNSGTGAFTKAQPAFSDISGQATNAQLATQTANTVLGALTATTPSGLALPSCTDTSGNHLNYTSGTGFSCGTTDAHVGTVTSVATTGPISGGTITATGTIACPTCATTTNGGALSGSPPVAISAGGAISLSGAAGQVPNGASGTFTATPTLGASGTTGTLSLVGSSSGTAVITPQAAAGTPTLTLGTSSGTPAVTASSPLAITTATGNITCATCNTSSATVSNFTAGNLSPLFTTTVGTSTTTPALTFALTNQNANIVYAGPGTGATAAPTFRSLVGADLPVPSASTLGGVESLGVVSHKWINTISTSGVPAATQPACGDLSDSSTGCTTTVGTLATLSSINNSNWSGTQLAIGNGGTNATSASAGFNNLSPMTTLGDTIYGGISGTGTRLAGQTSAVKEYLSQTGTGAASAAPAWAQIAFSDLSGSATAAQLPTATAAAKGIVQGDGSTLPISAGVIACATGTTSQLGCLKPDGTSITVSGGVISAVSGGSGTVTTTGTPATGNLSKFSGATSITNGDLSGDLTTSGTLATTLATVNSNVGSFTSANITVNAKGLITAAANGAGGGVSSFTGDGTILSNSGSTGAVTATLANAGGGTVLSNNTASGAAPAYNNTLTLGTGGYTPVAGTIGMQVTGNTNNYYQISLQNINSGSSASSDFVVTSDDGTNSTHYADFGINNSTGGSAPFTTAHAAYLYSIDNELDIGAVGASGVVNFYTTGTTTPVKAGFFDASQNLNLTNALAIAQGGTGQTTKAPAFNALSPMTTSGDVIYGGASGAGTRLGANASATKEYLQSFSSGIPAWGQVAFGDLSGQATNAQLATQTANTVLGALTATTPSGLAVPSCTDTSGNHLNWTSGTGFSCGTTDSHAGTVTSVTFTGDGTVESSTPSSAVTTTGTVTATLASAAAGTVLGNATSASAAPTYTSVPILGKAGTLGSVTMGNATSGLLTLEPQTGALGTVTVTLPAATDQLVGRATTDTLTNKSIAGSEINSGVVGSSFGGAGAITGALKANGSGTVSQAACADLSNGATGCSTATGTSGATLPLLNAANTWSGVQTITNSDWALLGSSTGKTTFTSANAGASNFTLTVPAATDTIADLAGSQAFTNKDLTGAGNTFPTFNQNTSGSAAKWTTARNLAGNSVDGSANVAFANKFIVQGTTDAGLSSAQFLGALSTGVLKNTTTTGVLSNAAAADIVGLFSGCSSTLYLGADGACHIASGSGTVTSVATDATLTGGTITTTGTLGLNLSNANTWAAVQTFTNSDLKLLGSSTGATTFTSANAGASNFTITIPAVTDTIATLGTAQSFTALQTFTSTGDLYLNGAVAWTAVYAGGNTGTSYAINIDNGNEQSTTITGAVAITLTAPTHPGKTTVILTQDGTGHVYSITGCKWPGGTAITYSTAASKIDVISIMYDGTNFYCTGGAAFSWNMDFMSGRFFAANDNMLTTRAMAG